MVLHVAPENTSSKYRPAFPEVEYSRRIDALREILLAKNIGGTLIAGPRNLNYFTGFHGWSFYMPQFLVVTQEITKLVIRKMDAPAGGSTTYLKTEDILCYSEDLIDSKDAHALSAIEWLFKKHSIKSIGLDYGYGFQAKFRDELNKWSYTDDSGNQSKYTLYDISIQINALRSIKSDVELDKIRETSHLTDKLMETALTESRVGATTAEVAAKVNALQTKEGGCFTAIQPMIKVNENAAHMTFLAGSPMEYGDFVSIELGAAKDYYHCPLSRSKLLVDDLGELDQEAQDFVENISRAVSMSLLELLRALKVGRKCNEVHAAFNGTMARYGMHKDSRVGYSFGIGFPPDWGDNALSVNPVDETVLQENMCLHFIVGCGDSGEGGDKAMERYAFALSEPVILHSHGVELLTRTPRILFTNAINILPKITFKDREEYLRAIHDKFHAGDSNSAKTIKWIEDRIPKYSA